MEILSQFTEILKYTLPALIVFVTAYLLITRYLNHRAATKAVALKLQRDKEITLLRLQAYERLALLLERIHPLSVVTRVRTPDMLATELQYAMIKNIREEFEHNLSQQIYVGDETWQLIVAAKEEILKYINMVGNQMPSDASAGVFIHALANGIERANTPLPTEQALSILKQECRTLF
ncbi:MAG: hypothetical protein NZM35_09300 [Chitinophagales bacterium]|nr:hypothetical protein [Chitinophagales bacterium]MDW8419416.1 hypothetical protein [Chitinophagales bacterium]